MERGEGEGGLHKSMCDSLRKRRREKKHDQERRKEKSRRVRE